MHSAFFSSFFFFIFLSFFCTGYILLSLIVNVYYFCTIVAPVVLNNGLLLRHSFFCFLNVWVLFLFSLAHRYVFNLSILTKVKYSSSTSYLHSYTYDHP